MTKMEVTVLYVVVLACLSMEGCLAGGAKYKENDKVPRLK